MADFYGTVSDADTYHTERGNTAWAGTDDAKEAALVRASAYVDGLGQKPNGFGGWIPMFPGTRTGGRAQPLAWPRVGASDNEGATIDSAEVPREVEMATYEAALRELLTPGSLSPDYTPGSTVKREKLDVIETEYATPSGDGSTGVSPLRPVLTVVSELLAPVMMGGWLVPTVLTV